MYVFTYCLIQVPVTAPPEDSDELDREADWIYKHGFCKQTITRQVGGSKFYFIFQIFLLGYCHYFSLYKNNRTCFRINTQPKIASIGWKTACQQKRLRRRWILCANSSWRCPSLPSTGRSTCSQSWRILTTYGGSITWMKNGVNYRLVELLPSNLNKKQGWQVRTDPFKPARFWLD